MAASLASCVLLAALVTHVNALVIPEELPSLLSLIYSNIPPIKKGTDSRIGLGFRLGPHADFQVVLELGPQRETEPLGNDVNAKKRRQVRPVVSPSTEPHADNTDAVLSPGKWLHSWKSGLVSNQVKNSNKIRIAEDPSQSSNEIVLQLKQLYKKDINVNNKQDSENTKLPQN
ncbi:uncharacterized protein LOC134529809 [Bacillus rossius redtenbacheri]|uniref:uncharacterized protein LOC134529809 n=1 Tax=Bacillus rossius redtenbacheri TaxID=93214 RepID=UPI002FDDB8D6